MYNLFKETRSEYDEMAKRELQKAFVENFDQVANRMIEAYIKGLIDYRENPGNRNGRIGHYSGADKTEEMMRSIEGLVGVQDYDVHDFREELWERFSPLLEAGLSIDYRMDARLEEAAIQKLCPGYREIVSVLSLQNELATEQSTKRDEVIRRLINRVPLPRALRLLRN